jgi:SpoVK/Ycf46/Vps4 family AAA+-type ATPase
MGKKKKKDPNPSSSLKPQQSTPRDDEEEDAGGRDNGAVLLLLAVDALKLRLDAAANGKASKLQAPGAFLSRDDAHRLDVLPNEDVFLLACAGVTPALKREDATIPFDDFLAGALVDGAARCNVSRIDSVASSTTEKSPGRRGSVVSKGTIQVAPASFVDILCRQDDAQAGLAAGETVDPPPQVTPDSSSVASSPPFSFKAGGGGDRLYSSPPTRTPSPYRTPPKPSPSAAPRRDVWVVPAASDLGRRIGKRLCRRAKALQLAILEGPSFDPTKVDRILSRILLAQLVGRYVQLNETMHVSFQGRTMRVRVSSIQEETQSDDSQLELSLKDLSLEPQSEVGGGLETAMRSCSVRLFEVVYSTTIDIQLDERLAPSHPGNGSDGPTKKYVAGVDAILDQVRTFLLAPLARSGMFKDRNLKPPRGLLLHGPSGVGKSSIAKQLAAGLRMDGKFDVEFVNCISLQSQTTIVGEAERTLSKLFWPSLAAQESSTKALPKLLILDDIHLICPKRGGYNTGTDRLTATLLSLMDGLDSSDSVFTLAITSQPSMLDPALRRPGRLDTEVEVPLPDDASTRSEILKHHVQDLSATLDATEAEWLELAKLAKGFNGADCMLAVKEALRNAIFARSTNAGVDEPTSQSFPLSLDDMRAGIRLTKPSAIKSISVEIPQVLWSSIGGMESVKEELKEAIELPLTHAGILEQLRVPPPKGILLYGPPGCSKTLMARALATQGHMNFLAVKGPELLSKWLGESERALASLFRRARMASPSIVFFDEIDAIACKRGMGNEGSTNRLLSQLLTELDGVNHLGSAALANAGVGKKLPRVVVIGATNRPDLLDPALTRPGRIDRKIYVGVPDQASRAQIFRLSLQGRSCGDDVDVDALSQERVSGGYSGAEIVAICRDAALLTLEDAEDPHLVSVRIEQRHLLKAISSMKRQITPQMIEFYDSYRKLGSTSFG